MFKMETFETEMCWDKQGCLEKLVEILNSLDDVTIIDIEKDWKIDNNKASYSPRVYLVATVIYKEN